MFQLKERWWMKWLQLVLDVWKPGQDAESSPEWLWTDTRTKRVKGCKNVGKSIPSRGNSELKTSCGYRTADVSSHMNWSWSPGSTLPWGSKQLLMKDVGVSSAFGNVCVSGSSLPFSRGSSNFAHTAQCPLPVERNVWFCRILGAQPLFLLCLLK